MDENTGGQNMHVHVGWWHPRPNCFTRCGSSCASSTLMVVLDSSFFAGSVAAGVMAASSSVRTTMDKDTGEGAATVLPLSLALRLRPRSAMSTAHGGCLIIGGVERDSRPQESCSSVARVVVLVPVRVRTFKRSPSSVFINVESGLNVPNCHLSIEKVESSVGARSSRGRWTS